jgi:hypothetical protein
MLFAELNLDVLTCDRRTRDRILSRYAAVVFDLHFNVVVWKDLRAEIENLAESATCEPMVDIIADPRLEQAFARTIME